MPLEINLTNAQANGGALNIPGNEDAGDEQAWQIQFYDAAASVTVGVPFTRKQLKQFATSILEGIANVEETGSIERKKKVDLVVAGALPKHPVRR